MTSCWVSTERWTILSEHVPTRIPTRRVEPRPCDLEDTLGVLSVVPFKRSSVCRKDNKEGSRTVGCCLWVRRRGPPSTQTIVHGKVVLPTGRTRVLPPTHIPVPSEALDTPLQGPLLYLILITLRSNWYYYLST